jgi:hypothetical protein
MARIGIAGALDGGHVTRGSVASRGHSSEIRSAGAERGLVLSRR